jgi:hypothetical protein
MSREEKGQENIENSDELAKMMSMSFPRIPRVYGLVQGVDNRFGLVMEAADSGSMKQ